MDTFDQERQNLYDRFVASLSDKTEKYFFDEDDIIEIIDYAGDLSNDFVRIEALMYGARYFPDSAELRRRRAVLYTEVIQPENREGFADVYVENDVLTALSKMDVYEITSDEARSRLREIFDSVDSFNDEETIRFIMTANLFGLVDDLFDNFEAFKLKTTNVPIALYQMADSYMSYNPERAALFIEQLVEFCPMVPEYWRMLAEARFTIDAQDLSAMENVDMALALQPDYAPALALKAKIITCYPDPSRYLDEMERIYQALPLEEPIVMAYLSIMDDKTRQTKGEQILSKTLENSKIVLPSCLTAMLNINPAKGLKLLDHYIEKHLLGLSDIDEIIRHIARLNTETAFEVAKRIMDRYNYNELLIRAAEALFVNGGFRDMLKLLDLFEVNGEETTYFIQELTLLKTVALYKLRDFAGATECANKFLSFDSPSDNPYQAQIIWNIVNFIGAQTVAYTIINLSTPEGRLTNDPDEFTFLGLWS